MGSGPRHLLIVACSRRKRPGTGALPALERYDGVNYRILRKARREDRWPKTVDLLILSARHGLLEPGVPIEWYEQRMTPQQATQIRPMVIETLAKRLEAGVYDEVFLNVGRSYRLALEGWETTLRPGTHVLWAKGGIGQKASAMLRWLDEKAEAGR